MGSVGTDMRRDLSFRDVVPVEAGEGRTRLLSAISMCAGMIVPPGLRPAQARRYCESGVTPCGRQRRRPEVSTPLGNPEAVWIVFHFCAPEHERNGRVRSRMP